MTTEQKQKIEFYRLFGKTYRDISLIIGIKESTIKTYCYRNHLTDKEILSVKSKEVENCCPNCGAQIVQKPRRKPRRFCSEKCRYSWWNKNKELKNMKALYKMQCEGCGKEFISYGNKERKYCTHQCYIRTRFGSKTETDE